MTQPGVPPAQASKAMTPATPAPAVFAAFADHAHHQRESLESVLSSLKKSGLRATNSRVFILNVLYSLRHRRPDAYEIYRVLGNNGTPVSMSNIYRVLKEMTKLGLIIKSWDKHVGDPRYCFQLATEDSSVASIRMTCPHCSAHIELHAPGLPSPAPA